MKIIAKRRRLENKTNYSKRMRLLEGRKPRIVIRKSNKYITLQYVESKAAQDAVKVSVISRDLLDYGWSKEKAGSLKSLGACYLAGFLFGNKIKKMAPAILDLGLIRSTKGSRIYAAVKGINDAGFKLPCSEEVFPEEKRIKNPNNESFFEKIKLNMEKKQK
jgi:large subunit ribosomal protein L18